MLTVKQLCILNVSTCNSIQNELLLSFVTREGTGTLLYGNYARFWLEYRLLFKLFWCETRPCEIHLNTIFCKYCFFRFLKSLTKLEKTGYRYFDELLSAVTTMFHTYEDRHQVLAHQWYVKIFVLLFTKLINIFLAYPVTGNYCQER